jgi:hypothetical protein
MLKINRVKIVDGIQSKMKNRRMIIKRYADNSYFLSFKRLEKDINGNLRTPVEKMMLSSEAFERLIGGGLTLIGRAKQQSNKKEANP